VKGERFERFEGFERFERFNFSNVSNLSNFPGRASTRAATGRVKVLGGRKERV